jgi:hypothetical protein
VEQLWDEEMRVNGVAAMLSCLYILLGGPVQADRSLAVMESEPSSEMAYKTQPSIGSAAQYSQYFGKNWRSIRTFKLVEKLNDPIRVYVERPSGTDLYKVQYQGYVEDGLKAWNEALDGRLSWAFVDNPDNAHIKVHWVRGFEDPTIGGLATTRVGNVRIRIKTIGIPDMDIKANIMHELGHALGINDHSSSQDDIMVATRRWSRNNTYVPHLSSHDKAAIRRLYSVEWQQGEDLYPGR